MIAHSGNEINEKPHNWMEYKMFWLFAIPILNLHAVFLAAWAPPIYNLSIFSQFRMRIKPGNVVVVVVVVVWFEST